MSAVMTTLNPETLREIVRPVHPVASVYLALEPPNSTIDIDQDLGLRWRVLAAQLGAQGADEPSLAAIAARLATTNPYPGQVALFAAGGEILLSQPLPGDTRLDRARFGAPADVLPLLAWQAHHPAYVSVVTDRCGADIEAVPTGSSTGTTTTVVGPDDEIERNAPGGWAQPRYQRRAEDSWLHNAGAVADAVGQALAGTGAGLLLVSGDVQAVRLLRERLQRTGQHRISVRHLPGGRSPDGSVAVRHAATFAAIEGYVAERTAALLARFAADRGPQGASVEGAFATLAALAAGRVHTLLISDEADGWGSAWFGAELLCAPMLDEAPDPAAPSPVRGPLVDVAVRAALLTDAEVRVLDRTEAALANLRDGIGALCRYRAD